MNKQLIEIFQLISKHGSNKVKVVPKFARPLAKKYAMECLELNFPDIFHACGAGSVFMYLDNKGTLMPCDREKIYKKNGYKILEEDFSDIWNSEMFANLFQDYNGNEIYENVFPCNRCNFLQNECFPCCLEIKNKKINKINECCILLDEINKNKFRRSV